LGVGAAGQNTQPQPESSPTPRAGSAGQAGALLIFENSGT